MPVQGSLVPLTVTVLAPGDSLVVSVKPAPTTVVLVLRSVWGSRVVLSLRNPSPWGPLVTLSGEGARLAFLPSASSLPLRSSSRVWLLPAGLPGTVIVLFLGRLVSVPRSVEQMFTGAATAPVMMSSPKLWLPTRPLRQGVRRKSPVRRLLLVSVRPGMIQLENLTILTARFPGLVSSVILLTTLVRLFGAMLIPTLLVAVRFVASVRVVVARARRWCTKRLPA